VPRGSDREDFSQAVMKTWVMCRLDSSTNFARAIAMGNLLWGYYAYCTQCQKIRRCRSSSLSLKINNAMR
jgi:hypothetical protein